jgi:hypothetical protein
MAKSPSLPTEREYVAARLQPVIQALKEDRALRDDFLMFARERGGNMALTLERLKTVWWPSRKSMYPGFFVLIVWEFGTQRGLISPSAPKR